MPEIIPIRDLKNTNAISQRCHETQEPIFVTKSGYGDMVIMSIRAPLNSTPFVRQYDILFNKWGVLLCQKEYQTNDIRRNSREWL